MTSDEGIAWLAKNRMTLIRVDLPALGLKEKEKKIGKDKIL